jgi:hypothetical protein
MVATERTENGGQIVKILEALGSISCPETDYPVRSVF